MSIRTVGATSQSSAAGSVPVWRRNVREPTAMRATDMTIIGVVGGFWLLGYFMKASAETMPDIALPIIVTPSTVLWAAFVGVVAVGLAPLLTAPRRLRKMDLPSTLRVME